MARVLIFANDNSTLYNFRRELLRRLVADGFDVTVALPAHDRNQAFRDLGCDVVEIRLTRFGTNPVLELATVTEFVRAIRTTKPDVILTFTAKPNVYGGMAARLCRVPYIGAVTGLGVVFQSESLLKRLSAVLFRVAFRRARTVFFENSHNAETFRRMRIVTEGQVDVVAGAGVNLALNPLEPYYGDRERVRFITVARIRRDKGYDELFEVIRRLCAVRDDLEFTIVGWYEDDSYRDTVAKLQASYPVTFHDDVPQQRVHELIAGSHALVHPSHHEGMANVILEASAAGVPPVVSDIPGCREAVEAGTTGLLFAVRDADALEAEMVKFLSLDWFERKAMGLAAHDKMVREFDRERVVDRYVAVIRGGAEALTGVRD